jgi:hypothetical protein
MGVHVCRSSKCRGYPSGARAVWVPDGRVVEDTEICPRCGQPLVSIERDIVDFQFPMGQTPSAGPARTRFVTLTGASPLDIQAQIISGEVPRNRYNEYTSRRDPVLWWSNEPPVVKPEPRSIGYDSDPNRAWEWIDNDTVSGFPAEVHMSMPYDHYMADGIDSRVTLTLMVKKDNVETRFPDFLISMYGSPESGKACIFRINTKTGAYKLVFSNPGISSGVVDYSLNWWKVWITIDHPGQIDRYVYTVIIPASVDNWMDSFGDGTETGSIIVDNVEVFLGGYPFECSDFMSFAEVDPDGDLTVAENLIEFDSVRNDAVCCVRWDGGSNYFGQAFTYYFTTTWTSIAPVGGNYTSAYVAWAVSLNQGDSKKDFYYGAGNASIVVQLTCSSGGVSKFVSLLASDNGVDVSDNYSTDDALPISWWFKLIRNGTTVTLYIYSDAARTVLLDTLEVTLPAEGRNYRFLYGFASMEWTSSPTVTGTIGCLGKEEL